MGRRVRQKETVMKKFETFVKALVTLVALFLTACGRKHWDPITPSGTTPLPSTGWQGAEHMVRHGIEGFFYALAWGWCFLFSLVFPWIVFLAIFGKNEERREGLIISGLSAIFALIPALVFQTGASMVCQVVFCTIVPGIWLIASKSERWKFPIFLILGGTFFAIHFEAFSEWVRYNPWTFVGDIGLLVLFVLIVRRLAR